MGESGCGKSTLLFGIAQLLNPPAEISGGSVTFRGRNLVKLSDKDLAAVRWKDMSVVMQSAMNALNPVTSVGAQFKDAMRAHGVTSQEEIAQRSAEVLRMVGIDPVHLKSYPHQLSGGMRQRSMIAMAMLFTPELIIMDEPTSALDVVAQRSLMAQIKDLQREFGFAVIFVTHDMSLVSHYSNRLMVMYAGQISEVGPTRQLFDHPAPSLHGRPDGRVPVDPGAQGLADRHPRQPARPGQAPGGLPVRAPVPQGHATLHDRSTPPVPRGRHPRCGASCMTTRRRRAVTDVAHPARAPVRAAADGEPLLRVERMSRHFKIGNAISRKSLHAVDDATFTVGERQIVAVAGESGSGKSTVARVLAKIYKPTSGEIYFQGKPLSAIRSRRAQARLQRAGADGLPGPVLPRSTRSSGYPTGSCGR